MYLKQVLEELHGFLENTIPVHAMTDHRGLYQSGHSTTAIDTQRLWGEMTKVKDHLVLKEVKNLQMTNTILSYSIRLKFTYQLESIARMLDNSRLIVLSI